MNHTPTLSLSIELIQQASVTPDDKNCQNIIAQHLSKMGFDCEFMYFGDPNDSGDHAEIKNLWAIKKGKNPNAPVLCFAGHTDVVPTGDESAWKFPPFSATVHEGKDISPTPIWQSIPFMQPALHLMGLSRRIGMMVMNISPKPPYRFLISTLVQVLPMLLVALVRFCLIFAIVRKILLKA